jgi:SAM-dependent methyltransferase
MKTTNKVSDALLSRMPGERFLCPVCKVSVRFTPVISTTGLRRHARCPECTSLERHRLQAFVLESRVLPAFSGRSPRVLHVAPEPAIRAALEPIAGSYVTADYALPDVDLQLDLRAIDLPDASFELVYASHVLEHIDRDRDALAEIRRILAPGGLAVLPVPLVGATTVEYPEPNPLEAFHVRAPGYDYYDRYREFFDRVEVISSEDAPAAAQTFIFEDRSGWPTKTMPHRLPSTGTRHADAVPLCWVD